jgi:hypothetical protein
VPEPATGLPGAEDLASAKRTWTVSGEGLPPLFVRFELNAADWPDGFDYQAASLYHHAGAADWELVPTTPDPATPALQTTNPVSLSSWTYAASGATPPPPLKVTSIVRNPDGSVALQWTNLGAGYQYTVKVSESLDGTWTPAPGDWPVAETTWTDPTAPGSARKFYRVEAVK